MSVWLVVWKNHGGVLLGGAAAEAASYFSAIEVLEDEGITIAGALHSGGQVLASVPPGWLGCLLTPAQVRTLTGH